MKILCHINSLGKGGAERVMATLIDKFIEDGHEVVLATIWTADDEYTVSDKVKRISVGLYDSENGLGRFAKLYKRYARLHDAIKSEKPDVILSFTRNANYRAILAASGCKVPVVVSERNNPATSYPGWKHKLMVEAIYSKAARIVCQTTMARDYFSAKLRDKSVIIANPLNPKYLNVSSAANRSKRIVTAGRLNGVKNQKMLLEAMLKVHEKYPDYIAEIYGSAEGDNTVDRLKQFIQDNKMGEYVKLMGDSNTLESDLVGATCFTMTSNHEGMPNALIEAMAIGVPVISTDCPGGACKQIVANSDSGYLVPVGDSDALSQAIIHIINEPEEADDKAKRAMYVRDDMNPDKIYDKWMECLNACI